MSAVKSLAFGVSMVAIAAHSAAAGSMHRADPDQHPSTERATAAPTTLTFARPAVRSNSGHAVAEENLAPSPGYGFAGGWYANQSGFVPGRAAGLSLGMTGGNLAPAPATPPPAYQASFASPFHSAAPAQSSQAPALAPRQATPDAFINFGNGPYSEASSLTTGTPQAFTNSPAFAHLYGPNGPTPADVANFESEVLSTIKATYNKAGLAISLTTDPNAMAAHTMSLVSGASYTGTPGAIGITDVGNNGFSFIDKFGGVQDADQLAIAIGHNMSHELMHAFGVANHPEQAGAFVDAATSTLQALTDPNTGFSQVAGNLLSTLNFQAVGQSVAAGAQRIDGDQILVAASTVPEPSAVLAWSLAGGLFAAYRRRKAR